MPPTTCPRCSLTNPPGTLACARCGEVTPLLNLVLDTNPPANGPRSSPALRQEVALDRRSRGVRVVSRPVSGVRARAQARLRVRVEQLELSAPAPRTVRLPSVEQLELPTPPPRPLASPAVAPPPGDSAMHEAKTDPEWIRPPDSEPSAPTRRATTGPASLPAGALWERVGAALLDAAIVGAVVAFGWVAGALAFGPARLGEHLSRGVDYVVDGLLLRRDLGALTLAFGAAVAFTYTTLAHALAGRTLGKAAFDLTVMDAGGERPSVRNAAFRSLALPFSLLPAGVGWVLALFDARRRTLHYRLVGTTVVSTRVDDEPDEVSSDAASSDAD